MSNKKELEVQNIPASKEEGMVTTTKKGNTTPTPDNGKSSKKPKSGKPGKRGKGKSGKRDYPGRRDDDQPKKPANINDIGWYTKYPSIVVGSSSHIFNSILGHKYEPIRILDTGTTVYNAVRQAIPGVVSLLWTPFYSMKGTEADAVNVASKNLYTYVRHANSGSVNYESSDLMQYVLCVAELFAYAAQLKRDLKMIFTFKATNRYLYQRVLWSSGYTMSEVNNMIANYAIYSNMLNVAIAQLNTFKIPKEMSFLTRHIWLAEHAWKDDDLDKATTYIYCMQGFYHYDWANGTLEFNQILPKLDTTVTFSARLATLQAEINNLLAYEDIGIMIGDILKAYGNESCYMCTPLLPGEVYEAEYSKEVTHQIRNAIVLGGSIRQKIKQVSGSSQLLYETQSDDAPNVLPVGTSTGTPSPLPTLPGCYYFPMAMVGNSTSCFAYKNQQFVYSPYLVIDSDSPTNEEIILNTRLMYLINTTKFHQTISGVPYDALIGYVEEAGTEVIVSSMIATFEDQGINGQFYELPNSGSLTTLVTPTDVDVLNHILSQAYKVDDCPQRCLVVETTGGTVDYITTFYYGKNVITVEKDWLALLHKGCKMSQFTMPMFKLLEAKK